MEADIIAVYYWMSVDRSVKVLSPVHTVAEKCDCRRFLAVFCESLTFL